MLRNDGHNRSREPRSHYIPSDLLWIYSVTGSCRMFYQFTETILVLFHFFLPLLLGKLDLQIWESNSSAYITFQLYFKTAVLPVKSHRHAVFRVTLFYQHYPGSLHTLIHSNVAHATIRVCSYSVFLMWSPPSIRARNPVQATSLSFEWEIRSVVDSRIFSDADLKSVSRGEKRIVTSILDTESRLDS